MYLDIMKLLLDVLKPVLGEKLKNRFKSKTGAELARSLSFELYEALQDVQTKSSNFIARLEKYSNSPPLNSRREALRESIEQLFFSISQLTTLLKKMRIPLQLHEPTLYSGFHTTTGLRGSFMNQAKHIAEYQTRDVEYTKKRERGQLDHLLTSVKQNQQVLDSEIESFRLFLKQQFTFKESF